MRSPSEVLEVIIAVGVRSLDAKIAGRNSTKNITFSLGENDFLYVICSFGYFSQTFICTVEPR